MKARGCARQVFIIEQRDEGVPVGKVSRKAGISQATNFSFKKKYAGMLPTCMKRLSEFENEKSRLQKSVADPAAVE